MLRGTEERSRLKHGRRPSDAISICDDEELSSVSRSRTPIDISDGEYHSLIPNSGVFTANGINDCDNDLSRRVNADSSPIASLNASSTTRFPSTRGHAWKGWDKSECTRKQKNIDASGNANDEDRQATDTQPTARGGGPATKSRLRPLTYKRRGGGRYWTHEQYYGPCGETVKIHYCKTKAESERVATLLSREPILGFDVEWKPRGGRGIKNNISLIQLACEDKIALFHVALHEGQTVDELVAPTLRKILESPKIIKTGVAIFHADGRRLQRFMKLNPRGLFELSYLHRLIKYHGYWPEKVNKKLVSLANQVSEHLGKPLFKGSVRVSDWTKPLSRDQIRYSAADAYAGFCLFHAMEAKRLTMVPPPPRPAFAELNLPVEVIESSRPAAGSRWPLHEKNATSINSDSYAAATEQSFRLPKLGEASLTAVEDDPAAKRALSALRGLRIRLSKVANLDLTQVASDTTLIELAMKRPRQQTEVESVPSWKSFSRGALDQGINLVDFLSKFAPDNN